MILHFILNFMVYVMHKIIDMNLFICHAHEDKDNLCQNEKKVSKAPKR